MNNATVEYTDGKMVITVDMGLEIGPSSTGKTVNIAYGKEKISCPGYPHNGQAYAQLTVYRYPTKKKAKKVKSRPQVKLRKVANG